MRTRLPKGGRNKRWHVTVAWDASRSECRVTAYDQAKRDTTVFVARGEYEPVVKALRNELRRIGVPEMTAKRALVGAFEDDR